MDKLKNKVLLFPNRFGEGTCARVTRVLDSDEASEVTIKVNNLNAEMSCFLVIARGVCLTKGDISKFNKACYQRLTDILPESVCNECCRMSGVTLDF